MAFGVTLALPTPALSIIGLESNVSANITGSVALVLPTPKLLASGALGNSGRVAWTLPTPQLVATLSVAATVTVGLELPVPQLVARGFTGTTGAVALTLPSFHIKAAQGAFAGLTLPTPQLAASGLTGIVGAVKLALPSLQLASAAKLPNVAQVSLALPLPAVASAGFTGNVAAAALTLRQLALAAAGYTGVVGAVNLVLPVFKLSAAGYGPQVGMMALALPMLQLHAAGTTSTVTPTQPNGSAVPAIVMNTETGALSHYLNFPFNSFAVFNGAYLASGPGGLFVLGGNTDNGVLINAAARVGITDFGTSFLKRIDRSYVGYRADGNLILRVYTDEINIRDYLLTATGNAGLHGNHVRIGRGLAARYWQFELSNQNGANFQLNMFEVKPTRLRRRIGGGDA